MKIPAGPFGKLRLYKILMPPDRIDTWIGLTLVPWTRTITSPAPGFGRATV
ncbi:hypothetical protein [Streptomyces sp. Ag82_O1-15]|uniref:hypothetical protein n=1 Tax=Streptomyces sp. Ag82_O1-15 TaxID=1938855 RepID=UPI0015CBB342|nr:hypothetical protein [Streptomyces sp. Ag82_O1-15]